VIAAPAPGSRLSRGFWPDFGFVWPRRRRGLVRQAHHMGFAPIPTGLGFVRQPRCGGLVQGAAASGWLGRDVGQAGLRGALGFVRLRTMGER
jgi:hypothetical protein